MYNNKKIVFCGPPASGKTTIKKVFFEAANPIRLLENPLDPTRGVETSIYKLFNTNIGLFDLAGQENENWFGKDNEIFEKTDTILIVFDIKFSLKYIILFLKEISKTIKKHSLFDTHIHLILHKIDLVRKPYIISKLRSLNYLIKNKIDGLSIKKIYRTSIRPNFFFKSTESFMEILESLLDGDLIGLSKNDFRSLKTQLKIILGTETDLTYQFQEFAEGFNEDYNYIRENFGRLVNLGLIEVFNTELGETFKLSENGQRFKDQIEISRNNIDISRRNKDLETIYTVMRLQKMKKLSK